MVRASWDCHVSFDGVRYSVPPEVAGKEVELREREGQVVVLFNQLEVTSEELATLRFLCNGENIIFIGSCGTGKTHLAIGLGLKALERGYRVNFLTLHNLITKVSKAHERHLLDKLLSNYLRADLLILDEVGFLPLQSAESNFLFELVNTRYQKQKAMIITSNKTFSQWEEMFPEKLLVVAILDRLLHHGHAIHIRGESYRLKHRREAGLMGQRKEVLQT